MKTCPIIFISAAELSGDLHAAKLIAALKTQMPQAELIGLGGRNMEKAGCTLVENLVARAAMLTHVLTQIAFFWKLRRRIKRLFIQAPPDIVVLVDSPAWNFHIAKLAKKLNIPVLHYIAPQLWAWGPWRVRKLRRLTDKLACILPFEPAWFERHRIDAQFVGHPLFDNPDLQASLRQTDHVFYDWNDYPNPNGPTIALLPGSRSHEIRKLWPIMAQTAALLKLRYAHARFVTTTSDPKNIPFLRGHFPPGLTLTIQQSSIPAVTNDADFCIVASGTATLEVAATTCPMTIIYDIPAWQWHLVGRWLIKTKFLSLVNILAGRQLVPEFMPLCPTPETITQTAAAILNNPGKQQQMRSQLRQLMEPIARPGASLNTAKLIQTILEKKCI